ncbi:fasciclin domain-containing protein [Runella sp. MFBS21]|uniref:fasciclin domain-containing protein n=1 Tax=Runella sp. MFBS21 TaxID=3034018 RepID=UPI0023F87986|nr:fasciclin domain-containing protein [Runella sp. MFBS21]MDF7816248.1 fasciclin domain-containing protein [Runella sp. MFBS21]
MKTFWRKAKAQMVVMMMVAAGATLVGCKDEETTPTSNTVTDIVLANNDFTILRAAVTRAGLADALKGGTLTVFAPNDAAFTASGLDLSTVNSLDVNTLRTVLQYHVLGTTITASAVPTANNTEVPTLAGANAYVTKNDGGVSINGARVITADVKADNGVIHVINQVIMPPSGNLLQVAQANPNFTFLVAALNKVIQANPSVGATVTSVLTGTTPFTVFAPTNTAFQATPFNSIEAINAASGATLTTLTNVLLAHVVQGRVFSTNLTAGNVVTAGNAPITVTLGSGVQVRGAGNGTNNANVTSANIVATNGVIHVIDRVILP